MFDKARSAVEFTKRCYCKFEDPYITKSLFIALVRRISEYASIVWSPCYDYAIDLIESAQKQYLIFALRELRPSYNSIPPP